MWNKITSGAPSDSPPPLPGRTHLNPSYSYSSSPPRPPSSGHPTRRQSNVLHSGHPRLTPRSSSLGLNLSQNSSTSSLASTYRPQPAVSANTATYRRLISGQRPNGVTDPLDELGRILGEDAVTLKEAAQAAASKNNGTSELLLDEEIDFDGLTLDEYLSSVSLADGEDVERIMVQTVDEYEKERDKFLDLHRSITACDEVLQSVESYLSVFKTDLGQVSAEIESLQNRSMSLTTKLENRRNVEKFLGPIVEDVALPPNTVRKIAEGDVNDSWVKALQNADHKIKAIESRKSQNIKAIKDIEPELERLTHKALERVRDHFVSKIKAIRSPGAQAQQIQQASFLRYRDLFVFMSKRHPKLADEIGLAYVNTMRWYYHSHFTRYQKNLEKMKLYNVDKSGVLGQEEPKRNLLQSMSSMGATAPAVNYDAFGIGRRMDTWQNQDMPLPNAQLLEEDKATYWIEIPFRCMNVALVDNAAAEYGFLTDFFSHKKYDQVSQMFQQIFGPTLALAQAWTKTLIDNTLDALGTLLCVRLNQQSAFTLQRRRVPVLENYINATNMLLWPRFQSVMDAHSESLRKPGLSTSKQMDMAKQNAAPHPITQKFGQFTHALLSLSAEAEEGEPVAISLGRLRSEFEAFLTKGSSTITDSKKKERFLFNNYSLVLTILSDTEGKLALEQRTHFQHLTRAFRP